MIAEKRIRYAGHGQAERFRPRATASSAVNELRRGRLSLGRASHNRTRETSVTCCGPGGGAGQDVQLELPVTAQNMTARLSNEGDGSPDRPRKPVESLT